MKTKELENRFFSKVKHSDDCWVWNGSRLKPYGYGLFCIGKRNVIASRWSWEFFVSKIPKGMFVCHHCDNPPCVNPFHLFIGTHSDNMKDCAQKGRLPSQNGIHANLMKTECPKGHKYDKANTVLYGKYRSCRTCRNLYYVNYRKRKKAELAVLQALEESEKE